MNREHLYHGKRVDNGEWIYGVPLLQTPYREMMVYDKVIGEYEDYEIIPETVGEYTGLTDKNGKKMFEDDYCLVTRPGIMALGVIKYKDACYWFIESKIQADGTHNMIRLCDLQTNGYEIQVKYNIHDKRNEKEPLPIEDMDFSVRTYNCLMRAGINTLQDLSRKTEEDLMKVRNLGIRCFKEVIEKCKLYGVEIISESEVSE